MKTNSNKKPADPLATEYPVIRKMYLLVLEYTCRVGNFPRDVRFILGDRILTNSYNILEGLIEARYAGSRKKILARQNIRLEKLRYQTRLCLDMKILSARQYGYLSERMDEVGRMIGGWLKSLR